MTALIIHGGCGNYDLSDALEKNNYDNKKNTLARVIEEGWQLIRSGASALDVVEKCVNQLEDDPNFNAGIGGALDIEKKVALDASIMRGDSLAAGAVAKLSGIPHAISVARMVLEKSNHVLLTSAGANRFALEHGFTTVPEESFITPYQLYKWNKSTRDVKSSLGTVGAVALDQDGLLVAGTSTGGITKNLYGRIGDSCIIGAGTYAENNLAAASATGYGEQIIRVSLTKTAADLIRYKSLSAMEACKEALRIMEKLPNGTGGIIMIDKNGAFGRACNLSHLPTAYINDSMAEALVQMETN